MRVVLVVLALVTLVLVTCAALPALARRYGDPLVTRHVVHARHITRRVVGSHRWQPASPWLDRAAIGPFPDGCRWGGDLAHIRLYCVVESAANTGQT